MKTWDLWCGFQKPRHTKPVCILNRITPIIFVDQTASLPEFLLIKPRHSQNFCWSNRVTPRIFVDQTASLPEFLLTKPRHSQNFCWPNRVTPRIFVDQTASLPCQNVCWPNYVTPRNFGGPTAALNHDTIDTPVFGFLDWCPDDIKLILWDQWAPVKPQNQTISKYHAHKNRPPWPWYDNSLRKKIIEYTVFLLVKVFSNRYPLPLIVSEIV